MLDRSDGDIRVRERPVIKYRTRSKIVADSNFTGISAMKLANASDEGRYKA